MGLLRNIFKGGREFRSEGYTQYKERYTSKAAPIQKEQSDTVGSAMKSAPKKTGAFFNKPLQEYKGSNYKSQPTSRSTKFRPNLGLVK